MISMCADRTLELNSQALAVLEYLAQREPDFADYKDGQYQVYIKTSAWYNGRECGITFSMVPNLLGTGSWLHIACFEHRNSDGICMIKWTTKHMYLNPPRVDDVPEEAYPNKNTLAAEFRYGEVGKAAQWIYNAMEAYYLESKAEVQNEK